MSAKEKKDVLLMGIDLGTTGVKIVLVDCMGRVKTSVTEEYPLLTPKPGWAQQNPSDWWSATVKGIRNILKKQAISGDCIAGIGLTGQMHGAVFLDANHEVLYPAILWCDQRTAKECEEITSRVGKQRVFDITCNPVLTGFQAPKILWLKNNYPQLYKNIHRILLPKDYIRFHLTGGFATDVSDASGTSLFDVKARKWSSEILDALEIPEEYLPTAYESVEITGTVSRKAADITGLAEGIPVVAGGGDQAAGAVGNGITREKLVSISVGTSGVVFAYSDRVFVDPLGRLHTFCHAVPGKWHLMGVMLSAGGSFRWLRDTFFSAEKEIAEKQNRQVYEDLIGMAQSVPVGSEGLIFLPYLTGERCPYPDPDAKGVFFGVSLKTTKAHFVRSVLEGVSFGLRDSLEIMKKIGLQTGGGCRVSGGGGRSPFWCQMLADIMNEKMVRLTTEEGPAYGAALLAGSGINLYPKIEQACDEFLKEKDVFLPEPAIVKKYAAIYPLYGKLYHDLKSSFDHLAKIS